MHARARENTRTRVRVRVRAHGHGARAQVRTSMRSHASLSQAPALGLRVACRARTARPTGRPSRAPALVAEGEERAGGRRAADGGVVLVRVNDAADDADLQSGKAVAGHSPVAFACMQDQGEVERTVEKAGNGEEIRMIGRWKAFKKGFTVS